MRYRILGPLQLRRDDRWVAPGPTKWRTLLAVLLCGSGQVVSTDRLIDELWGDRPPPTAGKLLQGYVSKLRKLLEDEPGRILETSRSGYQAQGYRLLVGAEDVDAGRFESLAEQGWRALGGERCEPALGLLKEALDLWHGTPFTDVPSTPAVDVETARLGERRLWALEGYAEALLRCGRHDDALSELEPLVQAHPLREGLRGRLMVALYRAGRQADALAVYQDVSELLAEQLGVDPGPPLKRLRHRILAADPTLLADSAAHTESIERPRQLPYAGATFTGRENEIAKLRTAMSGDQNGPVMISAIDGIGGIGKSALALRVAHELSAEFSDGQLYVDLCGAMAGLSPLEPGEVLRRFLRSLGLAEPHIPQDTEEASARFRSLVADRRLLVVLDNAATAEQVRPLLPGGTRCVVLVTSRRALTTLEGAAHLPLGVLPEAQGIALLRRLAGEQRISLEAGAAAAIVDLCGGLPLALRIAGARLAARPDLSLRALADRLADERSRLDQLQAGDLAVRASFRVSYDSLSADDLVAARAFRLLGLLDGPDVGVLTVAAGLGEPPGVAVAALDRLVDARLVLPVRGDRYGLHDLMRLFAREQGRAVDSDDARQAALDRVLRYYLTSTQRAVTLLDAMRQWPMHPVESGVIATLDDRDEADSWLEAERPSLVAAVVQSAGLSDEVARLGMWLTQTLHWYLYPQQYLRDHRTINRAAIRVARRLGDREAEAWALDNVSAAYTDLEQFAEARASLEAAIEVWRRLGNRNGEQRCICNLASVFIVSDQDLETAVALLERQIPMARGLGNDVAALVGMVNLGETYVRLGRVDDGLRTLTACLEEARRIGDSRVAGIALGELGMLHLQQQRPGDARVCLEQALAYRTAKLHRRDQLRCLPALSQACRELGDLDAALHYAEEGVAISRIIGDDRIEASAWAQRESVVQAITGDE